MSVPRRVVTKIGDVYRINALNDTPKYLHFVAIDKVNMNSDVVVLYDSLESVSTDSYSFYSHTTVSEGVREGLWEKIANLPSLNLKELLFKNYRDLEIVEAEQSVLGKYSWRKPEPNWVMWTPLDTNWHVVDLKTGIQTSAEYGGILPASDIIYRIDKGISEFEKNWPEESS